MINGINGLKEIGSNPCLISDTFFNSIKGKFQAQDSQPFRLSFPLKRGLRQGRSSYLLSFSSCYEGFHNAFEEAVGNGLITGVNIKNSTIMLLLGISSMIGSSLGMLLREKSQEGPIMLLKRKHGNDLITGLIIKNSTINVSIFSMQDDVIITTDGMLQDMDKIIRTTEEKVDSRKPLMLVQLSLKSNGTESKKQIQAADQGNDAHVE
ncbi:hypothetical protein Tco_0367639 [Tanacetum coccineum]